MCTEKIEKNLLPKLRSYLQDYKEYKHTAKHAPRKDVRIRASDSMNITLDRICEVINDPIISEIIVDDHPYQFEEFPYNVEIDLPKYIRKIESYLEKLKSEKE